MTLPKILILNQPFVKNGGGGITLINLFRGWDKNKLAVACTGHQLDNNINRESCNHYYQLGIKEYKWQFPFNFIQRKYNSGFLNLDQQIQKNSIIPKSNLRSKIVQHFFFPFLEITNLAYSISKIKLSPEFCEWLGEFNPDIIYVHANSRSDVLFSSSVYDYLRKPMVFHMMDDWPSTITSGGMLKKYWSRKIDSELRSLFNRTSLFMGISDLMAEEYKRRYHQHFVTFHNPIDINFWKPSQKKNYILKNPPTLLYAGRTGLGIEKSLQTTAEAVQQINEKLGIRLKFMMCTLENPSWSKNYPCVEYKGFLPYHQMPALLSGADLLLLPYDFSEESVSFIGYSMPTKATEYMMSGSPILVFAPEKTAIVQYARKNKCAKIVTENLKGKLIQALEELVSDRGLREEISSNAKRIAETLHNGDQVRADFRNMISSLV